MKFLLTGTFLLFLFSSCSLTSTTSIKSNESFELGNNQHGRFSVKLKNLASDELRLWKIPVDGGRHSPLDVQPNQTVRVKVEKNTGLRIENNHPEEATVQLLVKGDLGLSMGYRKQ